MLYRGTCFHWVFFVRLGGVGPCRTPYDGTVGFSLRSMEVVQFNRHCLLVAENKDRVEGA